MICSILQYSTEDGLALDGNTYLVTEACCACGGGGPPVCIQNPLENTPFKHYFKTHHNLVLVQQYPSFYIYILYFSKKHGLNFD